MILNNKLKGTQETETMLPLFTFNIEFSNSI